MIVYLLYCRRSGKFYVGQTRTDLQTRWTYIMRGCCNIYLQRALKKHKPESFDRQILATCSSESEMNHLERLWIAVLKSSNPRHGYNIRVGGNSVHSVATKRKISKSKLGHSHDRSTRKQISRGMKAYWKRKKRTRNHNRKSQ